MNYKAHIFFGVLFSAIFGYVLTSVFKLSISLTLWGYILFFGFVGSIFPDVDMKNSTIVWILLSTSVISLITSLILIKFNLLSSYSYGTLYCSLVLLFVSVFFPIIFKHRGFTHSILFNVLVSVPICFINYMFAISFFIGALSHLILDMHFSFLK